MRQLRTVLLALALIVAASTPASAHQPYFEDSDLTAANPYAISDISVSLAYYGTLADARDVDYFTFRGKKGQAVLLSLVIPVIDGQASFTPTLALLGAGLPTVTLPTVSLPSALAVAADSGAIILRAAAGQPSIFYEPFGRRNYYERQEATITLPATGRYTVAIWSESGQKGRYTFSPGSRELFGGDRDYRNKIKTYWMPVP